MIKVNTKNIILKENDTFFEKLIAKYENHAYF